MPPRYESLVVPRHARVGIIGELEGASEAWLILHGYGMLAQGILHWFRAAERPGRVLIAPEGLSRFYVEEKGVRRVGASWLTREDRENDLADQQAYLDRVVDELAGAIPRLQVHGFSQGVAAAARWVVRGRRQVERLVCWGGTVPHDVEPGLLASALGGRTVHFTAGDRDVWVAPTAIDADALRLREGGCPAEVHHFVGGHRVDNGVLAALDPI